MTSVIYTTPTPNYAWLPYSIQSLERVGFERFYAVSNADGLPAETDSFTHIRIAGLPDVAPPRRHEMVIAQLCSAIKGPLLIVEDPVFVLDQQSQSQSVFNNPPAATTLDKECVPCVIKTRPSLKNTIDKLRAAGKTLYEFNNGMPWMADADELLNCARANSGTELKSMYLNSIGIKPAPWITRAKLYHHGHARNTAIITQTVGTSSILLVSWRALTPPLFQYLKERGGLNGTAVSLGTK